MALERDVFVHDFGTLQFTPRLLRAYNDAIRELTGQGGRPRKTVRGATLLVNRLVGLVAAAEFLRTARGGKS